MSARAQARPDDGCDEPSRTNADRYAFRRGGVYPRPLHENGADYLAQEFVQAAVTSVAEINLCVPKAFGPLILLQGTPEQLATLNLPVDALAARKRPLVEGKFQEDMVVATCPGNYDAYVWRAENCKRDEALRVVYRKGKSLQI